MNASQCYSTHTLPDVLNLFCRISNNRGRTDFPNAEDTNDMRRLRVFKVYFFTFQYHCFAKSLQRLMQFK